MINAYIAILALIATFSFLLLLAKHIRLKNSLIQLKEVMKQHTLKHGVDDQLWEIFVKESRKILGGKSVK